MNDTSKQAMDRLREALILEQARKETRVARAKHIAKKIEQASVGETDYKLYGREEDNKWRKYPDKVARKISPT